MIRKTSSAVALAGLVLLVSSCGKKEIQNDIKIGLVAELSGDLAAVGASSKNAAEMAVAEINEAGGIELGRKAHGLLLIIEDSAGKADQAAAAARRLIDEEKVLAFVGPNASLGAVPAAAVAEEKQILMITPWATAPKVTLNDTGQPRKYVFRACFTDPFEGTVLARFGLDYLHAQKAAVLYDAASEAPRSQAELFKKDFEAAGGSVVAFETYKTGDKDFTAQMKAIKAAGPDIVFSPSYISDLPLQLKQARDAGIKAPFLGSDNWNAPELLKSTPEAEGSVYCTHYYPKARVESTGRFVISYGKRFAGATPDDVAALTYDAFGLLKTALKAAGKADRQAVREAMAGIRAYEGATGKMAFKAGSGDPTKSAVMMKISEGKNVFVTTVEP